MRTLPTHTELPTNRAPRFRLKESSGADSSRQGRQVLKTASKPIVVLGVDPGSNVTGLAVVSSFRGVCTLIEGKNIRLKGSESERLAQLHNELMRAVQEHQPTEAGIEKVFAAKNPASTIKLGQARGVAIAALALGDVVVFEYAATRVKNTIVGYGRAEKSQVQQMVRRELKLEENLPLDASDAAAIALTHIHLRAQILLQGDNRL